MALTRKSKPAEPVTFLRVRTGVNASTFDATTGRRVRLTTGDLFPSDHPSVTEHAWAFEPSDTPADAVDDDAWLAGAWRDAFPTLPEQLPIDAALVAKLDASRAELEALNEPLARPTHDADVDALAAQLADRDQRRRALEMVIPALEREVIAAEVAALAEYVRPYDGALGRAAHLRKKTEEAAKMAAGRAETADNVTAAARGLHNRLTSRLADAKHRLEAHEAAHGLKV